MRIHCFIPVQGISVNHIHLKAQESGGLLLHLVQRNPRLPEAWVKVERSTQLARSLSVAVFKKVQERRDVVRPRAVPPLATDIQECTEHLVGFCGFP